MPYKSVDFKEDVVRDLKTIEVRLFTETTGGIYTTSEVVNGLVRLGMRRFPKTRRS